MLTKLRSPGAGAIRKRECKPLARKWLVNRHVVLHSDGARSYKLKVQGVVHDAAVHKSNRKIVKGKVVWIKPNYSKVEKHILPGRHVLFVKSGTQIVDRFWQKARKHIKHSGLPVGSPGLRVRIRSAQWLHWNQGADLWAKTAEMMRFLNKA